MRAISNDIEFRGSEAKTIKSEDGKEFWYVGVGVLVTALLT